MSPPLHTLNVPLSFRQISTASRREPCLSAFSIRLRTRMAKASGSRKEFTSHSGRDRTMRPGAWSSKSRTIIASMGTRSCGLCDSAPPPSAFASSSSFPDSTDRLRSDSSISATLCCNVSSDIRFSVAALWRVRFASGVRSSWALLAVKLRSESSARCNRSSSRLTAMAIGSNSRGS